MKTLILSALLALCSSSAFANVRGTTSLTCKVQGLDKPQVFAIETTKTGYTISGTSYESTVSELSFRDNQILLIAMDKEDPTRVRLVLSAQQPGRSALYVGQIVVDDGGHELQYTSGVARCTTYQLK